MRPLSVPPRWVMVTGAMRSGTTFVGRILATGWRRAYLHEPFNPSCGLPGLPLRYLVHDSDAARSFDLDAAIESVVTLRCRLGPGIYRQDDVWRRFAKRVVGGRGRLNLRIARINPALELGVIKDPIGALVAPRMSALHDVSVVVMVRHPVAWYASIAHHGFDLTGALDALVVQSRSSLGLMGPSEVKLASTGDHVDRAGVVWTVIYRRLQVALGGRPGTVVVRHEDLASAPEATFRRLVSELDLSLPARAWRRLERSTRAGNPIEAPRGRSHGFRRDSRQLVAHRLAAVGADDRRRLFERCGEVASAWYSPATFEEIRSDELWSG